MVWLWLSLAWAAEPDLGAVAVAVRGEWAQLEAMGCYDPAAYPRTEMVLGWPRDRVLLRLEGEVVAHLAREEASAALVETTRRWQGVVCPDLGELERLAEDSEPRACECAGQRIAPGFVVFGYGAHPSTIGREFSIEAEGG